MKAEDIDASINETMERLSLNLGPDTAHYDEAGAQGLLRNYRDARSIGYDHGIASALMFLGRLLEIQRDFLGARLFYLLSKTMFRDLKSMHWVPAKEYLSECPRGDAGCQELYDTRKTQVEARTISAEDLIREHFPKYAPLAL